MDFERFEKEVKTFALIKKKYDRLLKEFYSEEVYKGSYVDQTILDRAVLRGKQDENNRLKAFAQQHLINHRIIEYLACLQVQMDNLHQFLKLMVKQLGKEAAKSQRSTWGTTERRSRGDRRAAPSRRKVYDLGYQGPERRRGVRRRGDRRASS